MFTTFLQQLIERKGGGGCVNRLKIYDVVPSGNSQCEGTTITGVAQYLPSNTTHTQLAMFMSTRVKMSADSAGLLLMYRSVRGI
jgi:hypothetical protein